MTPKWLAFLVAPRARRVRKPVPKGYFIFFFFFVSKEERATSMRRGGSMWTSLDGACTTVTQHIDAWLNRTLCV